MSYSPVFGAVCFYEYSGDLIDFIALAAELGLNWIEYKYEPSSSQIDRRSDYSEIRSILDDQCMGISVHLPFDGLNIGSVHSGERVNSCGEMERALDYAYNIGADRATIHGGQIPSAEFTPAVWSQSVESNQQSLEELVRYGKERGIALCLENGNSYEREWIKHGLFHGEMNRIRSRLDGDISFTVDFGHALYMGSDPSFLVSELGADNVLMSHLHDNDGTFDSHSPLGAGILKIDSLIGSMIREQWAFPLCLEMKNEADLIRSASILQSKYKQLRE